MILETGELPAKIQGRQLLLLQILSSPHNGGLDEAWCRSWGLQQPLVWQIQLHEDCQAKGEVGVPTEGKKLDGTDHTQEPRESGNSVPTMSHYACPMRRSTPQ